MPFVFHREDGLCQGMTRLRITSSFLKKDAFNVTFI